MYVCGCSAPMFGRGEGLPDVSEACRNALGPTWVLVWAAWKACLDGLVASLGGMGASLGGLKGLSAEQGDLSWRPGDLSERPWGLSGRPVGLPGHSGRPGTCPIKKELEGDDYKKKY